MAGRNSLFRRQLAQHGKDITLQNRAIQAPGFGVASFDELFTNTTTVKAIIKTKLERVSFDGVNTEDRTTHIFMLTFVAGVTSETWILFDGRRFDILAFEDCCEDNSLLKLKCVETGVDTKEASRL